MLKVNFFLAQNPEDWKSYANTYTLQAPFIQHKKTIRREDFYKKHLYAKTTFVNITESV